eukprot:965978-Prymnesium_polylepis.1
MPEGEVDVRGVAIDALGARSCDYSAVSVSMPDMGGSPVEFLNAQLEQALVATAQGGSGGTQTITVLASMMNTQIRRGSVCSSSSANASSAGGSTGAAEASCEASNTTMNATSGNATANSSNATARRATQQLASRL